MKTLLFFLVISLNLISACGQSISNQNKTWNTNQDTTNSNQSIPVESQILRTEKFKIKDYTINLVSKSDKCELNYKKGEMEKTLIIDVPPPCKTLEWQGVEDNEDGIKWGKKLKRFVYDYGKFPKIKGVVIVIIGAATKANVANSNNRIVCKGGNGFEGFRIILVKDDGIKRGYGSTPKTDELYAKGCEDGLLARFFDGPFLQFKAEEEYP